MKIHWAKWYNCEQPHKSQAFSSQWSKLQCCGEQLVGRQYLPLLVHLTNAIKIRMQLKHVKSCFVGIENSFSLPTFYKCRNITPKHNALKKLLFHLPLTTPLLSLFISLMFCSLNISRHTLTLRVTYPHAVGSNIWTSEIVVCSYHAKPIYSFTRINFISSECSHNIILSAPSHELGKLNNLVREKLESGRKQEKKREKKEKIKRKLFEISETWKIHREFQCFFVVVVWI